MCERPPRAAGPRPSGAPRRERGWRSGPRGSPRPGPDPASAQPDRDAGAVRAGRRRDADRRWPARRARPGTRGPGRRAGRLRARRSGSSPRPPAGQRAVGLQGSDLGVQQLALKQHLAQFGFEPLGLQRLAIGGPRREAGLTGRHKGVPPSRQSRGGDAQRPREDLQILPPQQAYHRIALALARHPPTAAQTHAARSCCLRLHRHPPADHVRLQSVSANRGAHHNITWRALPAACGNWNSVWKRFWRLSQAGVFEAFFDALAAMSQTAHLVQMLDSTIVRAHVSAAGAKGGLEGHALGRSRGGFSTKIHLKADLDGRPLAFHLTEGQAGDSPQFEILLDLGPDITPRAAVGDKGYDAKANRSAARERSICPVIPVKSSAKNRPAFFPKALYRARARIEQLVGKLKRFKRIALRCEKTNKNFLSFVAFALGLIIVKSVHTA